MPLGKILNLGGIDNRPPKANQGMGRFRVARNVYPTPDGTLIPRSEVEFPASQPARVKAIHNISYGFDTFGNVEPLMCLSRDFYNNLAVDYYYYQGTTFIPYSSNQPVSPWGMPLPSMNSQSGMSFKRNNTTYFLNPLAYYHSFMKYDGVEMSMAGVGQPKISSGAYDVLGTKWIRAIQHKIDFDNTELWSEAVQFPVLAATTFVDINVHDNDTTNILDTVGLGPTLISPSTKVENLIGGDNYFKGGLTAVYNAGTQDFTISEAPSRAGTGNNTITVSGIGTTADLKVGMAVTGLGIPAGTVIATIAGPNSITLTNVCTTVGALTLTFPLDTNMRDDARIGSYVIVEKDSFPLSTYNVVGDGYGYGLALKLKSHTATSITLDALGCKYLNANREWIGSLISGGAFASLLNQGSRNFLSVWASSAVTGVFYYMDFIWAFPDSPYLKAYTVTVPNPPSSASTDYPYKIITLGPILNDLFDYNSRKVSPNTDYDFGGEFFAMTSYQDLLLLANSDLIWISDPNLGGNFETLNASAFIKVGDMQYGRITAICATEDFLFVSRERKCYYVVGNILTGNYKVQEVTGTEIGAWGNDCAINIKESIFFLTALGVYKLSAGGRIENISQYCPKNFERYNSVNTNEDVSFKVSGFISSLISSSDEKITSAYDEYRELLVFMKRGQDRNSCLVVHTKTGECYEWDGLINGILNTYADCMSFIRGKFYLGQVDTSVAGYSAEYGVENYSLTKAYVSLYPVKLYTTWLTAGEPSLEKILLQLKLFGRIKSNGSTQGIKICHYKDWDYSTKVTNSDYFPNDTTLSLNNQVQYSHKKRLNSDKVLAASVGLELYNSGTDIELESIEVEFNAIQVGMKK